jgi:hypothetical protein
MKANQNYQNPNDSQVPQEEAVKNKHRKLKTWRREAHDAEANNCPSGTIS